MSNNHIGEEGTMAVANMLKENRTLKKLDLRGDQTLGEGVDVLISSLQENKTLQRLRLSCRYQRPSDPRVEWSIRPKSGVVQITYTYEVSNIHPL